MAVGANDDQIHAVICGIREDDVGDRRTSRRHLLYVDVDTVTREIQGDISAGLLTVPVDSLVRIDNQKRDGTSRDEEGQRICDRAPGLTTGVPADQYFLADALGFPAARYNENWSAAREQQPVGRKVARQLLQLTLTE